MNKSQGLTRRQLLAATAASTIAVTTSQGVTMGSELDQTKHGNATFVLVHGAWHGGWCWRKLTPLLQAAGHQVFTPTLTGLGERAHLIHPLIDLSTHIQDILTMLEYEDLHNVILVGHSYGGMVIAGVAAKAETRLSQLVYLDAFLPENGKSLKDYTPGVPHDEWVRDKGAGWRHSYTFLGTAAEVFGIKHSVDLAWLTPRLGDQPYRTFTEAVELAADGSKSLRRAYIQLTETPFFTEAATRAKKQGFRMRELFSAGHDAMITQPEELAKILLELV